MIQNSNSPNVSQDFETHFFQTEKDEIKRMINDLMVYSKTRNIIRISEMKRFLPLFNVSEYKNTTDDKLYQLSKAFQERFNLLEAIVVVDDKLNEDGSYKILKRIPPVLVSIKELSEYGIDGSFFTAIANASAHDNPLSSRLFELGNQMNSIIEKALTEQIVNEPVEDNMKQFTESSQNEAVSENKQETDFIDDLLN